MARSAKYKDTAVFIGQDVDDGVGRQPRNARWWVAKRVDNPGSGSATLPEVMVDSGRSWTEGGAGGNNFAAYKDMIDEALEAPPLVKIEAYQQRVGVSNDLRLFGTVTNISEETIGYDNAGTLVLLAYEKRKVIHLDYTMRKTMHVDIEDDLAPGATMQFDEVLSDLPRGTNMSRIMAVVMVDYQPDPAGPFISANAAKASEEMPDPPPAHDTLLDLIFIETLPFSDTAKTTWATDEEDEVAASCGNGIDKGVWYEYVPYDDEDVVLDTLGSDFDTVISIWTGDEPRHPLTELACDNDGGGGMLSKIEINLEGNRSYYIKVGGNGVGGNLVFNMKHPDVVPTTEPPPTTTTPPPTTETPVDTPTPTDTPEPPTSYEIFMPYAEPGEA